MGLNKSVGNMYEWITHTWNPVKGCEFDCKYCYVKSRQNYSLVPRFSEKELETDLGRDRFIFVGSMTDMFGHWVPEEWIYKVLDHCKQFPDNQYFFQSKNPRRFINFLVSFPKGNTLLGTTIETNRDIPHISKAPSPMNRTLAMVYLERYFPKEVTIEPIIDFDLFEMLLMIKAIKPRFVSIGADSKKHNLNEPDIEKIRALIRDLSKTIEVKIKRNLRRIYP